MVWDRVPKGKRRQKLLGRYAGDKNIEIDSKYGREWLASVQCDYNPLTGMPCIEREPKNEWYRQPGKYPRYGSHEYRFRTSCDGWIAGPNSDFEPSDEETYEVCGQMVCRDCGDVYEPSEGSRPKATMDGYLMSKMLLEAGLARGERWVNPSDAGDMRAFVLEAARRAGTLNTAVADMRYYFGDVPTIMKYADDMEGMALHLFADIAQYAKSTKAGAGDSKGLIATCSDAKKRLKEIRKRNREARND